MIYRLYPIELGNKNLESRYIKVSMTIECLIGTMNVKENSKVQLLSDLYISVQGLIIYLVCRIIYTILWLIIMIFDQGSNITIPYTVYFTGCPIQIHVKHSSEFIRVTVSLTTRILSRICVLSEMRRS